MGCPRPPSSQRRSSRAARLGAAFAEGEIGVSTRNPMKDKVAIVGLGATKYGRDVRRTITSLGLEAAVNAIQDAGLKKEDIDGICGGGEPVRYSAGFLAMHEDLGIRPRVTWVRNAGLGAALV